MTDRLVWIDCEMTGLDLARDALVEIACLVTDGDLAVLDEGIDLVIKPPAEAIDNMPDVVREMHTASGLLQELPSGVTLAEAQDQVCRALEPVSQQQRLLRGEQAGRLGAEADAVLGAVVFGDREADVAGVVIRAGSHRENVVDPDHGVVIDGDGSDNADAFAVFAHSVDCPLGC